MASTKRPYGAPNVVFPQIAEEYHENTPELLKLKEGIELGKVQRQAELRANLAEIQRNRAMTPAEKAAAREKLMSKARIADRTDPKAAQLTVRRNAYRKQTQRDLAQAFEEKPNNAFRPQEINYGPGGRLSGEMNMARSEQVRTAEQLDRAQQKPAWSTAQKIASLKSQDALLLPEELQSAHNQEMQQSAIAFDAKHEGNVRRQAGAPKPAIAPGSATQAAPAPTTASAPAAESPVSVKKNSGGTMQRGGRTYRTMPGTGAMREVAPPADLTSGGDELRKRLQLRNGIIAARNPYGMAPEQFVAPPPKRSSAPPVPAYPIVSHNNHRADATLPVY
jgi:hypothetical protein